ncbi:MAG: prolyl oligopeptidase family serine peptidase [Hyphomonadaceae bacterium]
MARAAVALWLAGGIAACGRIGARAPEPAPELPPLIARADLFGDPGRQDAQISPRGDRIAFLAPRDGTLNLWVVAATGLDEPRPVTDDQDYGVREYLWAHDGASLIYVRDTGDENTQVFAAPAAGGEPRALSPEGARAEILGVSPSDPTGVIITLNQRDRQWPDVFRADINTGSLTLVHRNVQSAAAPRFSRFLVDRDNRLRLGLAALEDGGLAVMSRGENGRWSSLFNIPFEDAVSSRPIAFEAGGASFLMLDSTGRDRAALVRVDAVTGVKTVLGESPQADVVDVWLDPGTHAPEAFAADYLRPDWRALDADAQADLDFLDQSMIGDPSVVSRSLDDSRWIVVEAGPTNPERSYLYDRSDRNNRRLTLLFRHRPALAEAALQPMTPVEIEARDGLTLVSYLTLPAGSDANRDTRPDTPTPLVVLPHDGPWSRDSYGYNALHQWLANRGYAALSVNFRGSTGLGKAFLNAGNAEWGGRMQEDLLDAVQWAVEQGVARSDRVAIMGQSYGGYAALAALAFAPDRFRCGISYGGIVDLSTMLEAPPANWSAFRDALALRVGDTATPEGREALRDRSPLNSARAIQAPLLLAIGGRDPLASRADTDQLAQALRSRRLPFTYINFPDAGRALARPQDRLAFLTVAEHFLGECLGGRVEPVGAAFEGVRMDVLDGAGVAPGLSAFARRATPLPRSTPPAAEAEAEDAESTPLSFGPTPTHRAEELN